MRKRPKLTRRLPRDLLHGRRDVRRFASAVVGIVLDQAVCLPVGHVETSKCFSKCLLRQIYERNRPVERLRQLRRHLGMRECFRSGDVVGFSFVPAPGQRRHYYRGYVADVDYTHPRVARKQKTAPPTQSYDRS
jgi:hypothetical protein